MPTWSYIIVAVAAYLLGSIPTGFLVAKAKGIDIRSVGSGNIGATNAMRVLGKPAGIFVLLVDCAKGFGAVCLCVFFCIWYLNRFNGLHSSDFDSSVVDRAMDSLSYFPILAGIFAVLGHNYTCWLKFKGGKGIATTAGVYLALAPIALGITFVVFLLMLLATRYVSVASIAAAITLPVIVWIELIDQNRPTDNLALLTNEEAFFAVVTTALGALAIYKHRSNIKRLMNGTENRIGKKTSGEDTK